MKKTLCILLCAVLLLGCFVFSGSAESGKELKFRSDGTFRILHLTDTQDDRYPAFDLQNFLRMAIEEADPDLIVFTGDLVEDSRIGDPFNDKQGYKEGVLVKDLNGDENHDKTLEELKVATDNVLSIFEESGIPYALAQGNNDYKCTVTNEEWLEIYSQYKNNLTNDMSDDEGSRIDYNLEIKGNDGETKFNIWMMDSGRGGVNDDQIEWYKKASSAMTAENGGKPIPAFAFQHIHVSDVGNLFVECKPWEDGAKANGLKFYRLNPETASGYNFFAYTPCEPTKEFTAWKEQGDVIGAFFGHQHTEGFSGKVDGIELGFTYGCEFAKTGPYGYRVFTLHENDVTNYENEVYRYNGTVRLNNAKIEKQEVKPVDTYSNVLEQLFSYIKNFAVATVWIIVGLFG